MNSPTDTTLTTAAAADPQPLGGYRTMLTLLMLAYTLSMCDRMILSILFLPKGLESLVQRLFKPRETNSPADREALS